MGNEDGHLFNWVNKQPDTLLTLRAQSERAIVQVEDQRLLKLMKQEEMPVEAVSEEVLLEEDG